MNDINTPFTGHLSIPELLVRPSPSRIEGPQGYLLRLAEANCLTLYELKQQGAKYEVGWLCGNRLLPSDALGSDLHAHVHRMAALFQDEVRIWNRRQPRFCPRCLDEEPVWRASWELVFHDACPHHGVWLVDKCSFCGQPIPWQRDRLLRCPCGTDLRRELPGAAPNSILRVARLLEEKLLGQEETDDMHVLAGMTIEQTQRLVRYLGAYLDPTFGPKPMQSRKGFSLNASWPVSSLAAEILAQWPQAFHRCWSRMQDQEEGNKAGLKETFRQAHHYLYHGLSDHAFSPVRHAFEFWLGQNWKGGLSKRNRNLANQLIASSQWVPAKVAADMLEISPNKLRTFVQNGHLDGQESFSETGRSFVVVRRDQLDRLSAEMMNQITMATALQMLGLSKLRASRVLRLLFPQAKKTGGFGHLPWCIPRNEVDAVLALADGLPVLARPKEEEVTLAHVLKYWVWTTEQVVSLIDAVKIGDLRPLGTWEDGRGITKWVFNKAQLKAWWETQVEGKTNPNLVTVPEMARMLDLKQEVAYWLCRNGYFATERIEQKSGGNRRDRGLRVRIEAVEEFGKKYVFGRDIAAALRTSSRKVSDLLAEERIFPIRSCVTIPRGMLIYRRTDKLKSFLARLMGVPLEQLYLGGKAGSDSPNPDPLGLSGSMGNFGGSLSNANM